MCLKKNRWHTSISSRTVRQQNKFADSKWLPSLKMFTFYWKQYVSVSADEYTSTETHAIAGLTYSIWLWNVLACKIDYFVSISKIDNAQMFDLVETKLPNRAISTSTTKSYFKPTSELLSLCKQREWVLSFIYPWSFRPVSFGPLWILDEIDNKRQSGYQQYTIYRIKHNNNLNIYFHINREKKSKKFLTPKILL